MSDQRTVSGFPKAVVGDIARDTTNRPAHLRLKATDTFSPQPTAGGNGERKARKGRG